MPNNKPTQHKKELSLSITNLYWPFIHTDLHKPQYLSLWTVAVIVNVLFPIWPDFWLQVVDTEGLQSANCQIRKKSSYRCALKTVTISKYVSYSLWE
jgi:hypothetical protein